MNDPATLARARLQLQPVRNASSHGSAEIAYDTATGWFGALLAEGLIDPAQHAALSTELKAAQAQCDQRLQAADAASRAAHQQAADIELQSTLKRP